jgi:hypothetical protein
MACFCVHKEHKAFFYAEIAGLALLMVSRVGNRPGQALIGLSLAYTFFLSLSLAYGISNAIFLVWPGPAKSLA